MSASPSDKLKDKVSPSTSTADNWPTTAPETFSETGVAARLRDVGSSLAPSILNTRFSESTSDPSDKETVNSSTTASDSLSDWTLLY